MYRLQLTNDLPVLGIEDDSIDAKPRTDDSDGDTMSDEHSDEQSILRSYVQALLRVNRMRKGVAEMRKTNALMTDDLVRLEKRAFALTSGVQSLADDIQQFNDDLDVEYYLDDMIKRLGRYCEQIKYVPLRYTRREFHVAGRSALRAITSMQLTPEPKLVDVPGVRISQSDTTGLGTKSTFIY